MSRPFDEAEAKQQLDQLYKALGEQEKLDRAAVEQKYKALLDLLLTQAKAKNRPLKAVLNSCSASFASAVRKADSQGQDIIDTWAVLLSDLLFIAVPFIVVFIVYLYARRGWEFLESSEWPFAAAILTGQTLTKFVSGLLTSRLTFREPRVTIIMTLIIVLGVIPSVVFLILNLVTKEGPGEGNKTLPEALVVWQVIMFVVGALFYVVFGGVGELLKQRAEPRSSEG